MTTYATDTFTGDGSTVEFTLTFDYIERDHVTVSRLVTATQKATVLTVIKTGTPTGDEFIWEADNKIKVGTAPTTAEELVIARDTPENDQIVKWADGSYIIAADLNVSDRQWLYGLQELEDKFGKLQSTAIKYLGAIDLTVDAAPASPSNGDFYINVGSGSVLDSWTGIGGDDVVGSEQVVYNSTISEWQIFQVPSSQSGVLQVKGTAPITVDETDVQRPVVGITNATASADGAMSSSDKDKLDDIEFEAQKNVNADWDAVSGDAEILNKPTIPAAQVNSDWDATSGVAEILNKPNVIDGDAPSDGKTYGRKDAAWSEVEPGGVTSIIAGDGISVDQETGDVTVTATGGGGTSNMPTGGSGEDAFYENTTTINNNYSIKAGKNAGTFGPVTVNGDITVPDGSTWTVVGGGEGGGGGADAWGNVNADGTKDGEGYNFADVDKTGTGVYDITFTSSFPSADYVVTTGGTATEIVVTAKSTNGFQLRTYNSAGVSVDQAASFAVFATAGGGGGGGGGGGTVINYNGASAWGSVAADGTLQNGLNCTADNTGAGRYTVSFVTPMANSNYSVTTGGRSAIKKVTDKTSTGFNLETRQSDNNTVNYDFDFAVHASNTIAPQAGVGADAWGEVSGGGALQSGFNVTTTKTANATYEITFVTPMPSNSYAIQATCIRTANAIACVDQMSNTGFVIKTRTDGGSEIDCAFSFTVFASSTITPTFTWTRDGTTLKPANAGDSAELSKNIVVNCPGAVDGISVKSTAMDFQSNFYSEIRDTSGASSHIFAGTDGVRVWGVSKEGVTSTRNVLCSLDPDNPSNYTSTTNAEGETQSVYNGPTLDVKALLLEFQSKIETLEAAKAALEARITTLEGGAN